MFLAHGENMVLSSLTGMVAQNRLQLLQFFHELLAGRIHRLHLIQQGFSCHHVAESSWVSRHCPIERPHRWINGPLFSASVVDPQGPYTADQRSFI